MENCQDIKDKLFKLLTKSERGIAALMLKGYSRPQIASEKNLTINGVNFHMRNIFKKTECKTINMFLLKYGRNVNE